MLYYQNCADASDILAEYVFQSTMSDFVANAANHKPDNPHILAYAVEWMLERGEVFILTAQVVELLKALEWWPEFGLAVEHEGVMHCARSWALLSPLQAPST
jgi:hypothetical protein